MSWDQIVSWFVLPGLVTLICIVGAVLWVRHISPEP